MSTANDSSLSVGASDEPTITVFRFHARKIRSHQDERLPSLVVDLDPSRHGLYDLIQTVLQVHHLSDLPAERILEQRLRCNDSLLEFAEMKFAYGLTPQQLPDDQRHEDRLCCSATDPLVFNGLMMSDMGFQIGIKGRFNQTHPPVDIYQQNPDGVSFEFELVSIKKGRLDHIEHYECENVVTVEMQQAVANLRDRYQVYKHYCYGYARYRGRPVKLQRKKLLWSPEEEGILMDLIGLNCSFSKIWDGLLWYAFVNRTKWAVEQHYYILENRGFYYDWSGHSLQEVKQDCLDRMHAFLQRGDPNEFPMLADVEHRYHIYWD